MTRERRIGRWSSPTLRFWGALCVVAIGASVFAVAFRLTLTLLYEHLYRASNVVQAITSLSWWMRLLVPTCAGAAAGMVSRLRPSQGVSNVMEAVALGNVRLSLRTTMARVVSSWLAIAGGLSIGREGPLDRCGGWNHARTDR